MRPAASAVLASWIVAAVTRLVSCAPSRSRTRRSRRREAGLPSLGDQHVQRGCSRAWYREHGAPAIGRRRFDMPPPRRLRTANIG
jgi:hypothetical protein